MFCPKCGSENGDGVAYCRACGIDLAAVRGALEAPGQALEPTSRYLSPRQIRRLRRRGLTGTEAPLTLAERAIELQSSGVRALLLGVFFVFLSALFYPSPPIGGFFWILMPALAALFLAASASRFLQARLLKKLIRADQQPPALTDAPQDYLQPPPAPPTKPTTSPNPALSPTPPPGTYVNIHDPSCLQHRMRSMLANLSYRIENCP